MAVEKILPNMPGGELQMPEEKGQVIDVQLLDENAPMPEMEMAGPSFNSNLAEFIEEDVLEKCQMILDLI